MYVYLILVIVLVLLEFLLEELRIKERKTIFIAVTFTLLSVLACLRSFSVGTDTEQFVNAYVKFAETGFSAVNFKQVYEPGYVLYQVLLSRLSPNPRVLIVVSHLFINFSFLYFIKKFSKDYFISVCIFIFTCQFLASMCMMRQFIAIGIGLLAFPLLLDKKYVRYGLLVLVSASFHYFSLLYLLFIPIHLLKWLPKKWFYACLGLYAIIYAFIPQIIMFVIRHVKNYNDYVTYLQSVGESATLRVPPMLFVCLALLCPAYALEWSKTRFYKTIYRYNGHDYSFLNLLFVCLLLLVALAGRFGLLTRVYYYFTPYMCLIPNILHLDAGNTWKDRANLLEYVNPKSRWRRYPGMLLIKPASDWKLFYLLVTLGVFCVSLRFGIGVYNTQEYRFLTFI